MEEKLTLKQNILIGSLLFGLFFGAGNIIFPVQMGQAAGSNYIRATIGFLITGVGLPMLGVVASGISRSENLYDMAKPVSSAYAVFFTCLLYLTIGPLFAIPRTATVAFEVGIHPFISTEYYSIGLFVFSLLFFIFTLYYSLRPGRIIDWIGRYLNPTFVILLSILLIVCFIKPMGNASDFAPQGNYISRSFTTGILDGYNTMDALAGLAFAIVIVSNIGKLGISNPKSIAKETMKSSVVASIGMAVIYASLAYLGSTSLGSLSPASNGGLILSMASNYYFGLFGQILLAAIVTVACLKTAIGLITSCSEMFVVLFPKSLSYRNYAILFTIVSFVIANFGLNKIIQLSIPVLMFSYPLAIVLIILSLMAPIIKKNEIIYKWTIGFTIVPAMFDFINALPEPIKEYKAIKPILTYADAYLPLFDYGFGWTSLAALGFIIGILHYVYRK
ncbi:MAG: branched-chain amino acid transport system II carrier protein [Tissierellia bacterium]|nr:branched-chain amino acid transport system II carrier protein [Tissierellia bacterium]